jgi:hypothetical protein
VWGNVPLNDLDAFRRLYVLGTSEAQVVPFEARFGPPTEAFAPNALRWNLTGIGMIVWDLTDHLLDSAVARRDGGAVNGPCTRNGDHLRCSSPDDWNHVRVATHTMGGSALRCVFAHPQENSRLVIEVPNAPVARALVGVVGIDDAAFSPSGAPVENRVRFVPTGGGPPVERVVVTPNRIGVTPYRLDLGNRGGTISYTITASSAGARHYCFVGTLTR